MSELRLNGRFIDNLWEQEVGRESQLTAHPLGGCVMGTNIDDSVVDSFGRVHGYPNLYVADGSIVASPLSVNPSLTIAALAERIAAGIIREN